MIAVDTNIIVRFLVRDDEKQADAVRRRFKRAEKGKERLLIPLLVLLETIWVLESAYSRTRSEILSAIDYMRQMPVFEFESDTAVERFLTEAATAKADLADVLIANTAENAGSESGITFDKQAAKLPFFELLR